MVVNVPDIPPFSSGPYEFTISSLVCTHFEIGSVTSYYNGLGTSQITGGIGGLGGMCTGHYSIDALLITYSGDVQAAISDSGISLTMDFVSDPTGYMAVGASVSKCDAKVTIPSDTLVFSGSLSASLIDLFAPIIATTLTTVISNNVCAPLKEALDPAITTGLLKADDNIAKLVAIKPDPDPALDPDTRYVNWEDAGKVTSLMQGVNGFLNDHLDGNGGGLCGASVGGINGIIDLLTKMTGAVEIPFESPNKPNMTMLLPDFGQLTVGLNFVNASGLDTLTKLYFLDPTGEHSLNTEIGSEAFNMSIGIYLEVDPVPGGIVQGPPLLEEFAISFSLSDLDLALRLFLAVEADAMSDMTVYQLLYPGEHDKGLYWPCALSSLEEAMLTDLAATVSVDRIHLQPTGISSDGTPLESGIDKLFDDVLDLFVGDYNQLVTDSLYGVLQGPVRTLANVLLKRLIRKASTPPPGEATCPPMPPANTTYAHFDESAAVAMVAHVANEVLGPDGLNSVLQCAAEGVKNSGVLDGVLLDVETHGIHVVLRNLQFAGIGHLYDFEVLVSEMDHFHLKNAIGAGSCHGQPSTHGPLCNPLTVSFTVDLDVDSKNIHDQFNMSLALADLDFELGFKAMFDKSAFASLTIADLKNPQCLTSTFDAFELYDPNFSMGAVELLLDLYLEKKGEVHKVVNGTKSTKLLNLVAGEVFLLATNAINSYVAEQLRAAPYVCAGEPVPDAGGDDNDDDKKPIWESTIAVVLYACGLVLGAFIYVQKFRGSRKKGVELVKKSGGGLLDGGEDDRATEAATGDGYDKPLLDRVGGGSSLTSNPDGSAPDGTKVTIDWSDSLMFHKEVPVFIRYTTPFVLFSTIGLFISANIGVGATVGLTINANGQTYRTPSLFSFTLSNSVHDMWEAKVYPLSVLILVFSGVWPYVKLLCMLLAWTVPAALFPRAKRENLLMWLDMLGKYSLIDAVVLVMMMVAFRFHIALPADSLVADVYVTPGWGFYGFLLATMTSLAMGHIVLFIHRHAYAAHPVPVGGPLESLMDHVFVYKGRRYQLTALAKFGTFVTIVAAIVLLSFGVIEDSFNFDFQGAAGLVLGDKSQSSYSTLSLGEQIPLSVEEPDSFGIRWIELTYFVFVLSMPFVCLVAMFMLFSVKLSVKAATRLYVMAEVASAWSALEVFMISVVAALLEVQQFAAFIIGDKCDGINKILSSFLDKPLEGDDVCFDVVATLSPNCVWMWSSAILTMVVSYTMLRIAHRALEDRVEEAYGEDREESRPCIVNILLRCKATKWWYADLGPAVKRATTKRDDLAYNPPVAGEIGEESESGSIYQSSMSGKGTSRAPKLDENAI